MIPLPVRPVILKQEVRDFNYNGKWGLNFLHKTLGGACKHREPKLSSRLSPAQMCNLVILYIYNCNR